VPNRPHHAVRGRQHADQSVGTRGQATDGRPGRRLMTDIRKRTQSPGAQHAAEVTQAGSEGDVPVHAQAEGAVVLRTKDGWRVGGAELPDLTSAMVLADLLSAELAAAGGAPGEARASADGTEPGPGATHVSAEATSADSGGT